VLPAFILTSTIVHPHRQPLQLYSSLVVVDNMFHSGIMEVMVILLPFFAHCAAKKVPDFAVAHPIVKTSTTSFLTVTFLLEWSTMNRSRKVRASAEQLLVISAQRSGDAEKSVNTRISLEGSVFVSIFHIKFNQVASL
jgi:hypothetical protein